jgi:hypothetical protein
MTYIIFSISSLPAIFSLRIISRISSRTSYDNTNSAYNVTRILTPELTLDLEVYKAYSPLFLLYVRRFSSYSSLIIKSFSNFSTVFALSYGLSFASITATAVHTILYFRKQI